MGEGIKQMIHNVDHEEDKSSVKTTSSDDSSAFLSSSSSNLMDDACSSSSSSSSYSWSCNSSLSQTERKDDLDSNGPLYELSSLIAHLPIRRGLSKYYNGKSQSFTSLSNAKCTEDLAKKEITYNQRMKMCKRFTEKSDKNQRPIFIPGPCRKIISKKTGGYFGKLAVQRMNKSHNSCGTGN